MYLVRDVATGEGKHRLDIAWHLGQDLHLVQDGLYRVKGASQGLALLPPRGHGWAEEVRRESWSPAYGQKAPMTTLNFTTETALPAQFAVLLVTLEEAHQGATTFTKMGSATPESDALGYRYAEQNAECLIIFAETGKPWRMGSLSSDAEFVCWNRDSGTSNEHLILCGGSYATAEGGTQLHCTKPVAWAELVHQAGDRAVFSSDMAAVEQKPAAIENANPASKSAE